MTKNGTRKPRRTNTASCRASVGTQARGRRNAVVHSPVRVVEPEHREARPERRPVLEPDEELLESVDPGRRLGEPEDVLARKAVEVDSPADPRVGELVEDAPVLRDHIIERVSHPVCRAGVEEVSIRPGPAHARGEVSVVDREGAGGPVVEGQVLLVKVARRRSLGWPSGDRLRKHTKAIRRAAHPNAPRQSTERTPRESIEGVTAWRRARA